MLFLQARGRGCRIKFGTAYGSTCLSWSGGFRILPPIGLMRGNGGIHGLLSLSYWNSSRPAGYLNSITDREQYRHALPSEWAHLPLRLRWLKPTLFFITASMGIFTAAAYATNEETDRIYQACVDAGLDLSSSTNNDVMRDMRDRLNYEAWVKAIHDAQLFHLPFNNQIYVAARHPILFLRAAVNPETVVVLSLLPLALAWCFSGLHPTLFRHWTHSFRSGKSYTMVTTMVSHQLPFQWATIFAAWATVPITGAWFMHTMDPVLNEASPWYHMAAFCLSAGMFSFLAPQFLMYIRFRTLLLQLARGIPGPYTNPSINKALSYSVGASGVVHACLTLSVCASPNRPALTLRPVSISRRALWSAICAFETVGLYLCLGNIGWASNICGIAFGVLYSAFGPGFWMSFRKAVHWAQVQGSK